MERADRRERRHALDEKSAGLQKGNRHGHFEGRTAQAGGVRNDGNEGAVLVSKRPADDQRGTGFPRHAEIDQPDLTAGAGWPSSSSRDASRAAEAAPISPSSKG